MKTEQFGKPEEINNLALDVDVVPENWKVSSKYSGGWVQNR